MLAVVLLFGWSWSKLTLEEDITRVFPSDHRIKSGSEMLEKTGISNRIIISILGDSTSSVDDLITAGDDLNSRLEEIREKYSLRIEYTREGISITDAFDFYYNHLPYFLEDSDYAYLDSLLNKGDLTDVLYNNYQNLISPMGVGTREFIYKDPLHLVTRPLKRLRKWQLDDRYELVDNRLVSYDPLNLILFVEPGFATSQTDLNAALFSELDKTFAALESTHTQLNFVYFSGSRVAVANAAQVKRDVYLTVALALVMLLLLIGTYFRNPFPILKLFIPLALAGMTALTLLAFYNSRISIIAIGVGSVLLGISIDFALHLYVHFRKRGNILESVRAVAPSILMSCLTTAMAFFCLVIIESPAIFDLAIFAAISIVFSALYAIFLLPVFLRDGGVRKEGNHPIDLISKWKPEKSKVIVISILTLVLISLFFNRKVQFEEDLMALNYMPDEIKQAETTINRISSFSQKSAYLFNSGENTNRALEKFEMIRPTLDSLGEQGILLRYTDHSLFNLSEKEAERKLEKWHGFWQNRKESVYRSMVMAGIEIGFKENAFMYFMNMLYTSYDGIDQDRVHELFGEIYENFQVESEGKTSLITILKTPSDRRSELFETKIQEGMGFLIDRQYLTERFVSLLRKNFDRFVLYSLSVVFLVLWLFYGRIELAVITYLPIISAWSLTLALMSIFNIAFNIFNIMLASFVFGLGIDYCIFMMRGLQHKYETGKDQLSTFRASIYLSGLTTIIGTGVLIFAKHPAINSLAFIAIFGIGSVLVISNTIQPFLFNLMVYRQQDELRDRPVTLLMLFNSFIVYSIFILGSIFLILFRFVLLLIPLPKRYKKYIFHVLIMSLNWLVLNAVFHIHRSHIDRKNIDFKNPSIIIANHQSFADILFSLNFHPKVVLQTKDWVWNQWFLAPIIRYADCYPASYGLDQNMELIRDRMKEGYSMVIYPEGTRSEDLEFKRFHKGAFNLSEKLKADIQPIIYHGVGFMMPKHEPFLNSDGMNIKFLPRIRYNDRSWGDDHRERTKSISKYMREEYRKLREELEDASYFRRKLISKYIYKGPVLEWYLRVKLRMEKNYQFFNEQLPDDGLIYDVGCGYGFLSLMLHYTSKERNIIGIDYDEKKIEIAANAIEPYDQLQYFATDACEFDYEMADAFVLNDVLHYLPKIKQELLLKKCLDHLKDGGVLILRDADASNKKKHLGTRISEIISTGIGFNKKKNELEFMEEQFFEHIFREYPVTWEKRDDLKFTSNQVYVIRKSSVL